MKIRELMKTEVRSCRAEDDLSSPAKAMWEGDLGSVPVLDAERRVVGMITDRDICMAAYTQGRALHELKVRDAMATRVHSCHVDDELTEAEALMRAKKIRRIPVLDEKETLAGILSLNDIALAASGKRARSEKGLQPEEVVTTLGAVCAHRVPALEEEHSMLLPARAAAQPARALVG